MIGRRSSTAGRGTRWWSAAVVAGCVTLAAAVPAFAEPVLPWPVPGSPPLPPDPTVPYLPATGEVICPGGELTCVRELLRTLTRHRDTLGCDHDAIFADAYVTITEGYHESVTTPGYFDALDRPSGLGPRGDYDRPDRVNHEVRTYAQEYLDQFHRWHHGDRATVSPSWAIAFQAADDESVTALGDLLLQLNAHIRRDNPIRAIEQTEGVLRVEGEMPEASGRLDHDRISDVLQENAELLNDRLAARYDPTIDDGADLYGMLVDQKSIYLLISTWREESWRNAEQLRHARALGPAPYAAKLAEIEESARLGAEAILAAFPASAEATTARNAYCAAAAG